MRKQANNPPLDEGRRDTPLKVRWLGAVAGAAISLAPVCAYAGDAIAVFGSAEGAAGERISISRRSYTVDLLA
jgi:hypothetical protein